MITELLITILLSAIVATIAFVIFSYFGWFGYTSITERFNNIRADLGSEGELQVGNAKITSKSVTIDSNTFIQPKKLKLSADTEITDTYIKIGGVTVTKAQLQMLNGSKWIKLEDAKSTNSSRRILDSGGSSGDNDTSPKLAQKGRLAYMSDSNTYNTNRGFKMIPW